MSKVDAQRAMREAKFAALEAQAKAQSQGKGAAPTTGRVAPSQVSRTRATASTDDQTMDTADRPTAKPAKTPAKRAAKPAAEPVGEVATAASEELCGHRSIGNKRCQRPSGHAEANHRYK